MSGISSTAQPVPQQDAQVVYSPPTFPPNLWNNYPVKASKALGKATIVCGILSIIFQSILTGIFSLSGYPGTGIWCGVLVKLDILSSRIVYHKDTWQAKKLDWCNVFVRNSTVATKGYILNSIAVHCCWFTWLQCRDLQDNVPRKWFRLQKALTCTLWVFCDFVQMNSFVLFSCFKGCIYKLRLLAIGHFGLCTNFRQYIHKGFKCVVSNILCYIIPYNQV